MAQSRKTFTKIVPQEHPGAGAAFFTPEYAAVPDKRDIDIACDLDAIIAKGQALFGKSDGEWKYLDEHRRRSYIHSVRRPQRDVLPALFANMFRNDATYGIVTPSYTDVDRFAIKNQILLDLDSCYEFTHLSDVTPLLFEPAWGNPFGLLIDGKVLAPDSPRHYYFAEKLAALVAETVRKGIVEIGGGYGGLALMLRKRHDFAPYVIVDLFETCLIQYYFLKKAGLRVAFVLDPAQALEPGSIAIVPTDISDAFLSKLTGIGIIFNSRSFSEMSRSTVERYFTLIQDRLKPTYIYHENSNFLLFPDSVRHVEILASEFPVDPRRYRLIRMSISPFLGGGGRYREFLYESLKK
jgi:hypothetical protein